MPDISFLQIGTTTFSTTKEADDLGKKFEQLLGAQTRYLPARLAITRSLADSTTPPSIEGQELCKIIKGNQLFGGEPFAWVALIAQHRQAPFGQMKELQQSIGEHWHRGMKLLWSDWISLGEDFDAFLVFLATRAGVQEGAASRYSSTAAVSTENLRNGPIVVRIGDPGTDISTGKPVDWTCNAPGYSPHLALMGGTGSGKTHLGLNLLRQVKKQANCPIIFFDIAKGDIALKQELISPLGLEHIEVPRSPVPLNFLVSQSASVRDRNDLAVSFRDSFEKISRLGANQKDILRQAVTAALGEEGPTSFERIKEFVERECESRQEAGGTLLSVLNDLTAGHPLFVPQYNVQEFFSRSWLIDLHNCSDTNQKLVVFLILDAAKRYFMSLPDAPTDAEGNRSFRCIIAIDEARRVLGFKHPSLSNLIRLARSKGVGIWLMSQSPDDFDQEEDDFLQNIGIAIALHTNANKPRALRAILGGDANLPGLAAGEAITRIPPKQNYVRVKAWEPPKRAKV